MIYVRCINCSYNNVAKGTRLLDKNICCLHRKKIMQVRAFEIYIPKASPVVLAAVLCKAVVMLLLIRCWLLIPLWDSVSVLCFVVRCFVPILVFNHLDGEERAGCFVCLPCVSCLLCGSSSPCHGVVCSLLLWCFLIILTYCFFLSNLASTSGENRALYSRCPFATHVGTLPLHQLTSPPHGPNLLEL